MYMYMFIYNYIKLKGKEKVYAKLSTKTYVPFQVIEEINEVAYRLALLANLKISWLEEPLGVDELEEILQPE